MSINSPIEMTVDGAAIVLRKLETYPREGWAEDAALVTDDIEDQEWLNADIDSKARAELAW